MSRAYLHVLALITFVLFLFGPYPSLGSRSKFSSAAGESLGDEHEPSTSLASQPTAAESLGDEREASTSSASQPTTAESLGDEHEPSTSLASQPTRAQTPSDDSSSFIEKAGSQQIAGFFRSKFPFPAWPFPKIPPFPFINPAIPSVPTTPASQESKKLPSTPIKDNGDEKNP